MAASGDRSDAATYRGKNGLVASYGLMSNSRVNAVYWFF
jgi:hypothetical protein